MSQKGTELRDYGRRENDYVLAKIFNPGAYAYDDLTYVEETTLNACRKAANVFGESDPLHVEALINAGLFYCRRKYDSEAAKPYIAQAAALVKEVSQPKRRELASSLTAMAVLVGILDEDRDETFSVSALISTVAPDSFRDAADAPAPLSAVEIYSRMIDVALKTKSRVTSYLVSEVGCPLAIEMAAAGNRSGTAQLLKKSLIPLLRKVWKKPNAAQVKLAERYERWLGSPSPDAARRHKLERLELDLKAVLVDIKTISRRGALGRVMGLGRRPFSRQSERKPHDAKRGALLLERTSKVLTKLTTARRSQRDIAIEEGISVLETSISESGLPNIDTWIETENVDANDADYEALLPAFKVLACLHRSRPNYEQASCQERAIQYLTAFLSICYTRDVSIGNASKDIARVQLAELFGNRIRGEREDNANEILVHTDSLELNESKEPYYWALGKLYRGIGRLMRQETKLYSGAKTDTVMRELDAQVAMDDFGNALRVFKKRRYVWDFTFTQLQLAAFLSPMIDADSELDYRVAMAGSLISAQDTFTPDAYPEQWLTIQLSRAKLAKVLKHDRLEVLGDYPIDVLRRAQCFLTRANHPALWARVECEIARLYGDSKKKEVRSRAAKHYANCAAALPDLALERVEALVELAHCYIADHDYQKALDSLEAAIAVGERRLDRSHSMHARRVAISTMEGLTRTLSFCYFKAGRLTEAVTALDSGKCRLLRDCLQTWRMDLRGLSEATRVKAEQLRVEIRSLESKSYGGVGALEDMNRLIAAREEFKTLTAGVATLTGSAAATLRDFSHIPTDAAIVMPLASEYGGVVYIVLPGSQEIEAACVVELPNFTTQWVHDLLFDEPDGWFAAYGGREKDDNGQQKFKDALDRVASVLWDTLFESVCKRLGEFNVKEIILSPSGGLQFLPIHCAGSPGGSGRSAIRLIDNFRVRIAPSAQILSFLKLPTTLDITKAPLVAGVSNYTDLPPLASVVAEVRAVAQDLRTEPLLDDQVTIDALSARVPRASIVHLACHGTNWAERPDFHMSWGPQPVLRLSEGGISFNDIVGRWDLEGTGLITLSACDTGVVDFSRAWDEFEGLTHVLLQAGAHSVVSSLWSVDDESTALLMVRFYRNQIDRNMSPAQALADAQIWLRDSTSAALMESYRDVYRPADSTVAPDHRPFGHPYYWAPFYATG